MYFLSKLCFLCLSSYKKNETVLIEKSEEILRKLKSCLPEIIDSHSAIPKYVCNNCLNKLECFYKFKQICLQNNTHLNNYYQTLTSTAGESYKHLLVKHTDMKYQNKLIDQTMSTVGSDEELRTEEKEDNGIFIQEEIVVNETQCVDKLNIEESSLLNETENNTGIKEEFLISEHNGDIEFYHEYVKSIKCESIPSDSDVSASTIEDLAHQDSEYSSSNSKTNKLIKSTQNNVTEKNIIQKINKFQCAICSKEFLCKALLQYHLKAHAGIKDYKCSICSKKFILKCHLVSHEKIHSDIKNFECSICRKKFVRKAYLVEHEKIHTGLKNQECAVCKKKFMYKSHLVTHENVHTGLKPYECSVCNKKFMYKSNFVRHEKNHKYKELRMFNM